MKNYFVYISIFAALTITALARPGDETTTLPPVGYDALACLDHLWRWSGKVHTAMSSSADPTGGNMDMSQFHGKYKGENVLAEIEGPGCLYRIWSAWPSGSIKFYFDGEEKPRLRCDFKKYLEGKCDGLPADFIVGRWANYMPLPFGKSIIITAKGFHKPGYYQVGYQTYDPSVKVKSFDPHENPTGAEIGSAVRTWNGDLQKGGKTTSTLAAFARLNGDETVKILEHGGAGVIRRLHLFDVDNTDDALDDITLIIKWDGEPRPAVESPVNAFFLNEFDLKKKWPDGYLQNLFITADSQGYISSFPMPYEKGFEISLQNKGMPRRVQIIVDFEELESLPPDSMRFHAEYRSVEYETNLTARTTITARTPADPSLRYTVLERKGKGHYVGCGLFVRSVGNVWWGEGDEMTYIDGADSPQIHGTGTEDEFNWSWGFKPHASPVSGALPVTQECNEPRAARIFAKFRNPDCFNNVGKNIAYRFRLSDYVPFRRSIRVTYEILGASWLNTNGFFKGNFTQHRGDDYSSIAYWYEAP